MDYIARSFKLVSGFSQPCSFEIQGFDCALVNAGIGDYNLLKVSSILPPYCSFSNDIILPKGAILHTAFGSYTMKGEGVISSSVAVCIPKYSECIGVIMEYSHLGHKDSCIRITENLAIQAMKYRNIDVQDVLSIGCEATLVADKFVTTFAGLVMW